MKKILFIVSFFISIYANAQITIAYWNFNDQDTIVDEAIALNSVKGITMNTGGDLTYTPGAEGDCLASNRFNSGADTKYWCVRLATTGYENLSLSSKQSGTSTGPRDWKVQYSLDSTIWNDVTGGTIIAAADWTSGVTSNLALPLECDNKDDIYIRWIMTSNFKIDGTEPVAWNSKSYIDDVILKGSLLSSNDKTSIVASGTITEPASISSLTDTEAEATFVFDFNFEDLASGDLLSTTIDQIKISQGTNNDVTDWTHAIAGAILTGTDITGDVHGVINADNITFSSDDFISISDGTNETYELKVWLKTDLSNISDNDNLDFKLLFSDIVCDANGSSFGSGDVESGAEFIDIDATKIVFGTTPSTIIINSDFLVNVAATDVNNNIDKDYTGQITLAKETGAGTLSSTTGLIQNMVSGEYSWNDLQYDTEETFTISANSGAFTVITSGNIQCKDITYFINDDFEDGDLAGWSVSTANTWASSSITPINGNNSLHHIYDNPDAGTDQISHSLGLIDLNAGTTTWRFQVKYKNAAPSGNNNWSVFLFADGSETEMIPGGNINGYILGMDFTGTDDILFLSEITNGEETEVINTSFDWNTTNSSEAKGFEVTRTASGEWEVKIDDNGGFDNLISYGTGNNNTHLVANNFGVYYKYSSTLDMKLWLDDVVVSGKMGNDKDSELSVGATTEPTSISSIVNSQTDAVSVIDVKFTDLATVDAEPTIIDQIIFTQGTNNEVADWTNTIAGAVLTGDDITGELVGTIDNDSIIFSGNDFISIASGTNETYTLKIWLKSDLSNISDNDNLDFKLLYSNITCDVAGSSFGSGDIESGAESIDIGATKLHFKNIPSIVAIGVNFSVSVSATDINNNIDKDYSSSVILSKATGTGNLSSTVGLSQNMVSGEYSWSDLKYDAVETFSISASSGSFSNITSNDINCLSSIVYLDDDFEDNDIAGWQESTTGHWASSIDSPINGSYSLKQNFDNSSSDIDVISHPLNSVDFSHGAKAWRFQLRYENPDPSGNNNWSVFLMANNDETEMHPSGNINGYVFGINFSESSDTLKLWRLDNGAETEIIKADFDWKETNSDEAIGFEITRQTDGTWEIKIDDNGNFDNLQSYGTAMDVTYTTANYFGIYYKYSSTQDQKLWIDDVYFGAEIPDLDAPILNTLEVISPNSLKLTFNEDVEQTGAETLANYSVNNSIGNPNSATLNASNHKVVNLQFANSFVDNLQNELTIENVQDETGNSIVTTIKSFVWNNIDAISVSALSDSTLDILFTKELELTTATSITNYLVDSSIGNPTIVEVDATNNNLVHLKFDNKFAQEQSYSVNVANIEDVYGNIITTKDLTFTYYKANPYDIVINEIMFDVNPAPPALPVYEYIEIYNNSDFDINTSNWTITIGTKEHTFPDSIISAKSYAILCEEQATSSFSSWGTPLGILDISELTITGKRILIKDRDDNIIEDITYSPDWHTNIDKNDGGFSIERIDPTNFCSEEQNWATTANISMGGTPGSINSIYALNPDESKPTVLSVEYVSSKELKVYFSEKLERTIAETVSNYSIGSTSPVTASVSPETTSIINLTFADNFDVGTNSLLIKNLEDNCGNVLDNYTYEFDYQLLYPKTIEVISDNQIKVHFSEKVDLLSSQEQASYVVNNGIGSPSIAIINNADSTTVTLLFDNTFTLEQSYTLNVSNVKDVNDNVMISKDIDFVYYLAKPFDVVINEIMCDINPAPIAVPEAFYVELYNTSDFDIDLTDWKFISEGQTERTFSYLTLKSHDYLILCEVDEAELFSAYDNVLPLLSSSDIIGSGRNLKLISSKGRIIEEINYNDTWYNDEDKDSGGWSLERIDPTNFCGEETNWKACENAYGGTPGVKNSVFNSNQDNTAPDLLNVQIISSNYLLLEFSENISYESGNDTLNYSVNNGINYPHEAIVDVENRQFVHLHFSTQFSNGIENTLMIDNVKDNCGNAIISTGYDFTYKLIAPTNLWVKDAKHLKVKFTETVDSETGTDINNFTVNNGVGQPTYVARETSDTTTVYLEFADEFPNGQDLTLTISNVEDVNGNVMSSADLPFSYYVPKEGDIVINELLFHANSGGSEFVELYNRSDKRIDLLHLHFLTWDEEEDVLKSIVDLAETNTYFEPKTYLAFAKNKEGVLTYYMSKNQENIIELPLFPSLADKSGKVKLTYNEDIVIDEFNYSEAMQFQLLDSKTGVSLERINFDKPTQDINNWHSASEYVGFATPAYKNSQYSEGVNPGDKPVVVEPYMFSPDNDGIEDFANINYKFEKPGHVATIIIFDAKGRIVRQLANNVLLETEGTIVWDGLYDNNNLAPAGTYLIYFKVFDLDGNVNQYKIPVVSARRF